MSNDYAHAEALSHRQVSPRIRARGFDTLDQACLWPSDFVRWYDTEHLHSGIRYVTVAQRHDDQDHSILAERQHSYHAARNQYPTRCSGSTRSWLPVAALTLNPAKPALSQPRYIQEQ